MKKLTVQQAARELNNQARQVLKGTIAEQTLLTRLQQFTDSVEEAITHLQQQVDQIKGASKA